MIESEDDALEGFRAPEHEDDYTDDELSLMKSQQHRHSVLQMIQAGAEMQRFLETPQGQIIWGNAEKAFAEGIEVWLGTHDPGSDEARHAHFNARVAVSTLQQFQQVIDQGREALRHARQSDEDETAEG